MRILLSNDDGIHADGIHAMYKELKKLGEVWVVAPLQEKSTTGHSLTIHKPLRLIHIKPNFYGVSGSPADCVALGIQEVIGKKPDLVVSGINRGANLGQDVYYSGTVSAAREACMLGIPSLAVSLAVNFKKAHLESDFNYPTAAKTAVQVLKTLGDFKLPRFTMLNLNVPDVSLKKIKGVRIAPQGFRFYSGTVLRRKDHRGKDYYWVGGSYQGFLQEGETDCHAVDTGFASLTPLKLDLTDVECMESLNQKLRTGTFDKGNK
jgi:5'-nucleotidase